VSVQHPSSLDLEAFACGDAVPKVADHLADCAACGAFVDRARGLASEHAAGGGARLVVARAEKRARGQIAVLAIAVAVPIAAAAAALLWARTPEPTAGPVAIATPATATSIAMTAPSAPDPETTFKGGVSVAVVRERAGAQARFTSVVPVRAGDRLRVEVALDREQAILAAVIGDDDSYLELMPEAVRGAGTHFSELSARVDERPTRGLVVAGTPDAVTALRKAPGVGRRFDGLATVRVEWEGAP
jgi:hypothetical protein